MTVRLATRRARTGFVRSVGAILFTCLSTGFVGGPTRSRVPLAAGNHTGVGRIEGSVFDSLSMAPVTRAEIWISGAALKATTDSTGKFSLDSVPAGVYELSVSYAQFDSAGLGSLDATVAVEVDEVAQVHFASPSLRTFWRIMCANQNGNATDSGIVYGVISDGDNKIRLGNAPVQFSWYSFSAKLKQYNLTPSKVEASTDSTGMFYACGLPANVQMYVRALGDKAASGEVEYAIGVRRLTRLNFMVTKDLASTATTHGRGTLRGQIVDADKRPVAAAVVGIMSSDLTVRTDSSGLFELRGLPAGTQSIQVRKIGLATASQIVDLPPDAPAQVSVTMSVATALATVNVRAEAPLAVRHEEFLERRKIGLGTAIEFDKHSYPDVFSPLMTNGRISVKRDRTGTPTIRMKMGLRDCVPRLYLDGGMVPEEVLVNIRADDIKVVEIFASFANLPPQFMGTAMGKAALANAAPCGAIAYWTKNAW